MPAARIAAAPQFPNLPCTTERTIALTPKKLAIVPCGDPQYHPIMLAVSGTSLARRVLHTAQILGLVFGASATAHAAPSCPPSIVKLGGGSQTNEVGAKIDTSFSFPSPTPGTDQVTYDLVAGTLTMSQCCGPAETFVQASDAYDVAGVPLGSPVTVVATLVVDSEVRTSCDQALLCGGALVDIQIRHGADSVVVQHVFTPPPQQMGWHDTLVLPVTIVAGTPAEVDFTLGGRQLVGGIGNESDASATITFSGLPPGATMTSCQGFQGARATPAKSVSWGKLKSLYR